jgi:hypothetical protein
MDAFLAAMAGPTRAYLRQPTELARANYLTIAADQLTRLEAADPRAWLVLAGLQQAWTAAEHDLCSCPPATDES